MQEVPEKSLFNIEAECAVIGSFLIDPDAFPTYGATLAPERFYRDAHQLIHRAMLDMYARGEPCDIVTVTDEIERRGQLEAVDGAEYITGLAGAVPTSANVAYYVGIVIRHAQDRDTSASIMQYVREVNGGASDALVRHQARLEAIAAYGSQSDDELEPFLTVDELMDLPPKDWTVEGIAAANATILFIAEGGTGKTWTLQDWVLRSARAASTGELETWLGREVRGGHVFFVAGEGQGSMPERVTGWLVRHAADHSHVRDYFHAQLHGINLMDDRAVDLFIKRILRTVKDDKPISFIVLDTLSKCRGNGEENSNTEMGAVTNALDRIKEATGASVIVVHHVNGDGEARGASILYDDTDATIKLTCKDKDSGEVIMTCEKLRDGQPFQPVHFRQETVPVFDNDPYFTTRVIVASEGKYTAKPIRYLPSDHKIMRFIYDSDGVGIHWSEFVNAKLMSNDTLSRRLGFLHEHGLTEQGKNAIYLLTDAGVSWCDNEFGQVRADKTNIPEPPKFGVRSGSGGIYTPNHPNLSAALKADVTPLLINRAAPNRDAHIKPDVEE